MAEQSTPEASEAAEPEKKRKLRLGRWVLLTVLLWIAAAGLTLYQAQKSARAGETALRSVADLDDPVEADLDTMSLALTNGRADLENARSGFSSPVLWPMRIMPVAGRQLDSARSIVGTTADLVLELQPLVESARVARAEPGEIDRVAFLQETSEGLGRVEAVINNADLGPSENLVGPLVDARNELSVRLADLGVDVVDYRAVTGGLASFLDGGNYLLLGSNNAEMRLGSGMHLSIGRLEMADGEFDLPGLTPSEEFIPITGADTLDPDVDEMWGFLTVDDDFRKLGYSGRFDQHVAPQALEFWEAARGEQLDGVVLLDPFVLVAMLDVVGGVTVDGQRYDSANTLDYLLQTQYEEFDDEKFDADLVDARRDRLSEIASGVAAAFGTSDWDPVELVRALRPVARGRHLMVYSRDEVEQEAWQTLNVAGRISGDEMGVFWLNTGASKLDPFLRVSVDATTTVIDDQRRVDVTVTTKNNSRADLPRYTLGPWESLGLEEPGIYRGRIAFYAPGQVTEAEFAGDVRVDVIGADGPVLLVSSSPRSILPGETSVVRFHYVLPVEVDEIELLPSGRFPVVEWSWDDETFNDGQRRTLGLGDE